jgi:hypothetical protein
MALVVETGVGLSNAESYVAVADFKTYADARGLDYSSASTDALIEQALRRATAYIDTYQARFPGYRTNRRLQALEWPRVGAFYNVEDNGRSDAFYFGYRTDDMFMDPGFDMIAANTVPPEIVKATCEAAVREISTPGYLLPDDSGQGWLKSQSAGGSQQVFFAPPGASGPKIPAIALALTPLLLPGNGYGLSGRAVRC